VSAMFMPFVFSGDTGDCFIMSEDKTRTFYKSIYTNICENISAKKKDRNRQIFAQMSRFCL